MTQIDFKMLTVAEIPKLEELFEVVYPDKKMSIVYWQWLFSNPNGIYPGSIWSGDRLLGFCCGSPESNGIPVMYSAMIHPDLQGKGYFSILGNMIYSYLAAKNIPYIYLFANRNIRDIYTSKFGFIEACQINEYRLNGYEMLNFKNEYTNRIPMSTSDYDRWRFYDRPDKKYDYYLNNTLEKYTILSQFEDRLQIIDYNDLEYAISVATHFCKIRDIPTIAFWSEYELPFPFVTLPTWKMYKVLDESINIDNKIKGNRLRMRQSDVF